MSFSGMVKEELSRHIGSGRHCRIAELAAIFTFCGSLEAGTDGKKSLRIQTENEETVFYAEYQNTGEGAATASRASFGKQLNDISNYNEAQILAGDDGWNPVENGNVLLQNLKR